MFPRLLITGALVVCAALTGCATTPPQPKTTVILLPDEDGRVGAVSVATAGGTQPIDRAYNYATVEGSRKPSEMTASSQPVVDKQYDRLIAAQPLKPIHFTLNFVNNKTALTDESRAQLPAVMEAIRSRKPTEISIFGHTDSTGTEQYNVQLSAERAKAVAALLKKQDPTLDHFEIKFFGDREPLVRTDGRGAEPRNRRAEVMIL